MAGVEPLVSVSLINCLHRAGYPSPNQTEVVRQPLAHVLVGWGQSLTRLFTSHTGKGNGQAFVEILVVTLGHRVWFKRRTRTIKLSMHVEHILW